MSKVNPLKGVDPSLSKLGFSRVKSVRKKRISMEVSGKTKSGKSRFGLTMTEPIAFLNFDRSLEDLINAEEFASLDLMVKDFSDRFVFGETLPQKDAKLIETDFSSAFRTLLEGKAARSIVIDKATTLWEVMRIADFGRTDHVKPHHYVQVNSRMRGYLMAYQQHDKNILYVHDLKEEYADEKPTGRWVRDGFKYTDGLVQVNSIMSRKKKTDDDAGFRMEITGCAQNADLVGWEFENDDITWKKVAPMVLTDTNKSDWK